MDDATIRAVCVSHACIQLLRSKLAEYISRHGFGVHVAGIAADVVAIFGEIGECVNGVDDALYILDDAAAALNEVIVREC